jgi:hypothetical protein
MRNEEKVPEETPEEIEFQRLKTKAKGLAKGPMLTMTIEDVKTGVKRYGFFKMPDRHVLGLALGKQKINPVEATEFILLNCILKEVSTIDLMDDGDFWECCDHSAPLMAKLEEKKSSSTMDL